MSAAFIDFAQVKAAADIVQVATQLLGLTLKQNGPQYRGACAWCKQGGDRALAINTDKNSFYCFSAKIGGDVIALVSHIKQLSARDAASQIASHFKFTGMSTPASQPPAQQARSGFDAEAYLRTLDPGAEQLQPLGLSPDTLQAYRAGYCKTGLNRGRLAIALCDRQGAILGFCGRSLEDGSLIFPNGLDPKKQIFGQDHIQGAEVRLVRDPLEVLQAAEVGEPCVCFLTSDIEGEQLEALASLLDETKTKLFY